MIVPQPPDPAEAFERLHRWEAALERLDTLREHTDEFARWYADDLIPAVEAVSNAAAAIAAALQQPTPDDARQMWFRSHEPPDWEPLGTTGPVIGLDFGVEDPYESAVLGWPHQYGKTAALSVEYTTPFTSVMRGLFDALEASHQADLNRRLARLARDLGRFVPHVRHDFHAVQQVLEAAGITDGYGRITIPQPVRPDPLHA